MATKRPKSHPANVPDARSPAGDGEYLTTTIHIRREDWDLLRRVAFARALTTGGRASVSAVIAQLIQSHRDKLEEEAGR